MFHSPKVWGKRGLVHPAARFAPGTATDADVRLQYDRTAHVLEQLAKWRPA